MAIHPRRKSDAARRANQIVRSRTVLVMLLLGIMTFAALFWRLYDLPDSPARGAAGKGHQPADPQRCGQRVPGNHL